MSRILSPAERETLENFHRRLREVQDILLDLASPGTDPNALGRWLIGFPANLTFALQTSLDGLQSQSEAVLRVVRFMAETGDLKLPLGPTVYERAKARMAAAQKRDEFETTFEAAHAAVSG